MFILDCTLRDGGYYNNWDFDPEIVNQYLESVASSKIDFVELGLRNFKKEGFLGAFAYTTECFLNHINLPEGPKYGVMIDAKTILDADMSIENAINELFVPCDESKIDLVRVAGHFNEVERSEAIIINLKKLGYMVGYNLMQAGGKTCKIIAEKAKIASKWKDLDVLYFADSLGNMDGKEVKRIITALRKNWDGALGIHTHNNMGKGLDNTITALNEDVFWLDSTITGMGRGAGNTPTENLLSYLDNNNSKYKPKDIYELVIRHFEPMQRKYGWGSNLLYFLGAKNEVHPTYIQNLLSNPHYGTEEVIGAIDYLSNLEGTTKYNGAVLDSALNFTKKEIGVKGSKKIQGIFDNKDILIIANGPSTKRYASAVEIYIKNKKPTVISINTPKFINEKLIDYYAISHNSKFLSEAKLYKNMRKPIILPKCRFTHSELKEIDGVKIIDYGLEVRKDCFLIHGTHSTIPYDITSAYILAGIMESKVKSISVVGFDGYKQDDLRQQEMVKLLNLYSSNTKFKEIISLTPTSYPIKESSIYAPYK